jgi:hypothetical protein
MRLYQEDIRLRQTIRELKESLPRALFIVSEETIFKAKIYTSDRTTSEKIVAQALGKNYKGKEYELEVRVTCEADELIAEAYPKRKIEVPNPKEYAKWVFTEVTIDPGKLIQLVRRIIEFKGKALEIAARHVPSRTVRTIEYQERRTPNPEYADALDEYDYQRRAKGYVAYHPDEEGIKPHITTREERVVWKTVRGTNTAQKIRDLKAEELFEEK